MSSGQAFTGGGGTTLAGHKRIGFQLKFAPGRLDEYLKDHEKIWPEMQQALVETGWYNYSLFYRPDGLAFGYFETDAASFAEACERMQKTEVNKGWQAAMAKYTVDNASPIEAAQELTHYFYLGSDRSLDSCCPQVLVEHGTPWTALTFTGGGGITLSGHRRIGFQLKFAAEHLGEYLKDHEKVWPEMQQALVDTGWYNYSLFYRPDGLAFGYFETDASSFVEACERMEKTDVNKRWQAAMAKYTVDNVNPIDAAQELTNYFYLGTNRAQAIDGGIA